MCCDWQLVVSSVKDSAYYIREYSSNWPVKLNQLILSGGYFPHAVVYKMETAGRKKPALKLDASKLYFV